jgi:hypothetical protein
MKRGSSIVNLCSVAGYMGNQGSQQAGQTRRVRGPGRPGRPPWPAWLARGLPLTVKGSDCQRGTWWRGTRRRPGGWQIV